MRINHLSPQKNSFGGKTMDTTQNLFSADDDDDFGGERDDDEDLDREEDTDFDSD